MPTATQPIKSLLAIDISPVMIQVSLIERQEGIYRFAGVGRTPISISVQGVVNRKSLQKALHDLVTSTGHELLTENSDVLTPAENQVRGVDKVLLTWSLPAPINVVLVGLMPEWSLKAGDRLIGELPLEIIDQVSLTDGRTEEERMDVILSKRPDLVIMTGGVEGGADDVVRSSADLVARALATLPQELRPEVIYAGNSQAAEYVKNKLEPLALIFTAPNIQPSLSEMDIQPAREVLSGVCNRIWVRQFGLQTGIHPLVIDQIRPSILAIEDFISILGLCEKSNRGVIAIQINGLSTGLSVSHGGRSTSYQQLNRCMRVDPSILVGEYEMTDVAMWSYDTIEPAALAEHLAAETLYPGRLPVTNADAALDEAIARLAGIRAWHALSEKQDFPHQMRHRKTGAEVDVILITGNRLFRHRNQGHVLLEMLDIIQPVGLCEIFIDQDNLAASLGTSAHLNPLIPLHCILGQAVPCLATLIAPVHKARDGARLLSVVLVEENGHETICEVQAGELTSIPLSPGVKAELKISLLNGASMGARFKDKNPVIVTGSRMGIVIDARGRPLVPRKNLKVQQDWMKHSIDQVEKLVR